MLFALLPLLPTVPAATTPSHADDPTSCLLSSPCCPRPHASRPVAQGARFSLSQEQPVPRPPTRSATRTSPGTLRVGQGGPVQLVQRRPTPQRAEHFGKRPSGSLGRAACFSARRTEAGSIKSLGGGTATRESVLRRV